MKELTQYELGQLRTAREMGEENLKAEFNTLRNLAINEGIDVDDDIYYIMGLLELLEEYKDIIID